MSGLIDFNTLRRPPSPNTYLVAPDGMCGSATPDDAPPIFDGAPSELFVRLRSLVEARRDWRLENTDEDDLALRFVATSPILRFRDDVDIRVLPVEGGATIAVYSRSRVGYSDLGANRKRVKALIAALLE